jgi:hypothetical protein
MNLFFKYLCGLLFFLQIPLNSFGSEKYFTWLDPYLKTRVRVNLSSGELFKEVSLGDWKFFEKINLEPEIFNHLPPNVSNHYFFSPDLRKLTITLDGTGQVFELNFNKKALSRIDQTFFSGYNFGADVFERNGQIYSIGGVGFWTYNKAITYFDKNTLEWQAIRTKNIGPESIFDGYQGYSKTADKFFTGGSETGQYLENASLSINTNFYAYDFKTNQWQLLGEINPDLLKHPSRELAWNGNYFVQFSRESVYIIDPVKNSIFVYKSNKEQFQGGEYRLVSGDMVYCYWSSENGPLSKLSINQILAKATYLGSFYTPKSYFSYYLLGGLGIGLLLGLFYYLKQKQNTKTLDFDSYEKILIKSLMALDANSFLSTVEVNEILGLSNKSLENQRRIRLNTIAQINQKINFFCKVKKAIERSPSPEDKRLSRYFLNKEALRVLKNFF